MPLSLVLVEEQNVGWPKVETGGAGAGEPLLCEPLREVANRRHCAVARVSVGRHEADLNGGEVLNFVDEDVSEIRPLGQVPDWLRPVTARISFSRVMGDQQQAIDVLVGQFALCRPRPDAADGLSQVSMARQGVLDPFLELFLLDNLKEPGREVERSADRVTNAIADSSPSIAKPGRLPGSQVLQHVCEVASDSVNA